jgi:hypothetical protein
MQIDEGIEEQGRNYALNADAALASDNDAENEGVADPIGASKS